MQKKIATKARTGYFISMSILPSLSRLGILTAFAVLTSQNPQSVSAQAAQNKDSSGNLQTMYLGGGCFWCLEAVYELVDGVTDVESGYAGGKTRHPDYQSVTSGLSGHAEIVKISYDSTKTNYEKLLAVFWKIHNPTTLNRQGADVGTQYRSIVFYKSENEASIVKASIKAQQTKWPQPIVTEVVKLGDYYPAEAYHQDYFRRNTDQGYCQAVIRPKVEGFLKGK